MLVGFVFSNSLYIASLPPQFCVLVLVWLAKPSHCKRALTQAQASLAVLVGGSGKASQTMLIPTQADRAYLFEGDCYTRVSL